jgi:hypothetical protein
MSKDEALKLALEVLELVSIEFVCNGAHHAKKDRHEWLDPCPIVDRYKEAISAIKAALEAKDEPAAHDYRVKYDRGCYKCRSHFCPGDCIDTTPPQRKPLTDEHIQNIWHDQTGLNYFAHVEEFVRAIEAAHGIKGES